MTRKFQFKPSSTGDLVAVEIVNDENWYFELYHNYSHVGDLVPIIVLNSNEWVQITPSELVAGRWYVDDHGSVFRHLHTKDKEVVGDNFAGAGVDEKIGSGYINLSKDVVCDIHEVVREATTSEIHKALDAIRVHKGLVKGARVKYCSVEATLENIALDCHNYHKESDSLYHSTERGRIVLYRKGQWAQKLEGPILVTEDGYAAYELDNIFKVDSQFFKIIENCPCKSTLTTLPDRFKFFKYEQNALQYIEDKQPRYSNEDLEWLRTEVRCRTKETKVKHNIVECLIGRLKSSKND